MGIVEEDIDRVRSATDLVALVSEQVALRRVGTRWVGLCPFHSEKTGSFSVSGELGLYYCFGCQARGDAISWLRETQHLDFASAMEGLAARAGITLRYDSEDRTGPARKRSNELTEVLHKAVAWYHDRLLSGPDAAAARKYLRQRGYDGSTVRQFQLGWAPEGWDTLVRQLGGPGDLLIGAGLAFRNASGRLTDSFRARLLFPIFDAAGRPVGLGGRVLPGAGGPKYKNTQATALYDKSRVLYGLNWAKASVVERGFVVVCEGYTDVIGLHRAGVTQAVATCGTALAEGHVKLLTGFSRRIVLAYDADAAGQGAAEHFYDWEKRFDAEISVVALPPGTDPADLAQTEPGRLVSAVADATPYLGFRLQRLFAQADLRNPEGRARAAEMAMALVESHPDPLVKDQYLMQVADRCSLSPGQLRAVGDNARQVAAAKGPKAAGARQPGGIGRPERGRPAAGKSSDAGRPDGPGPWPVPVGPQRSPVPLPELEALRLAVHHPEQVAGRLDIALFSSELGREAFAQLASAMTLYEAIEGAPPQVADILGQLAVVGPVEDPDDVLRRLLDRATTRALEDLRRQARRSGTIEAERAGADLPALSARASELQLALQDMRSVEPGPGYDARLARAEASLLALLLGSHSMSTGPDG